MKARRSRIVYSLFLILLFVGTLPLMVVGWMLVRETQYNLTQDQRFIQLQMGKIISAEINTLMDRSLRRVDDIESVLQSRKSALRQLLERPDTAKALQEVVENGSQDGLLMAAVYDRSNFGITAGYTLSDPRLSDLMQEAYRKTLRNSALLFSAPYQLQPQGRTVLLASKPMEGALGVVQAVIDLEPLKTVLHDNSGFKNRVFLLNARHWLFLQSDGERAVSPEVYQRQQIVKELESQRVPATFNKFFTDVQTGERLVATVVPVRNLGWHVIVQSSERDIFSPVRSVIRQGSLWIALFVLLAALLSLVFARRISQPIKQLAATTRSIAQGNFSERVNIHVSNEIGEFAENFNAMTAKIEDYVTKLQQAVQQNKQLFLESIQTLAAAIDEKDPYTKGHSERVTHYSLIIGQVLGLGEEELEKLRVAALLHDIGKIGIDDRILKKPDVLTPEEFEAMKQHPEKGAYIVSKIAQLRDVVPGVRHHHEQVDGNGYPQRLSGDEIPLIARIISVADTFDAMTTLRPYQKPMSTDFVLHRIRSVAEVKFDVRVVAALERAVTEGKIKSFKGHLAVELDPNVVSG
ncbi:MAG: HD domain-containing protein [Acidobacteria bacterium]|nr:HD domain-containing protein [Acidobacteriota bacterium]